MRKRIYQIHLITQKCFVRPTVIERYSFCLMTKKSVNKADVLVKKRWRQSGY